MQISKIKEWKLAVLGALAFTLLSLYPHFLMWSVRGQSWNGSYAELHGDEWTYSAYVQALIDGRPRRNDSYTGRDDRPGSPQPESLFSIQFVPAYLIALPARTLGMSSSMAFIVLAVLAPFFACLAIFWLLLNLIRDEKLAAAGAVIVLCLGALAAGQGLVHLFVSGDHYLFLPFLRRYEPSAPFPLFFVFCIFVWRSLDANGRHTLLWAVAAGVVFALLVFSYFFLWTAAFAWFACIALLWFAAHPGKLRSDSKSFLTVLLFSVAALTPYVVLLSRRSATMDAGQKLMLSHAPDLFRAPEMIGLVVMALITFGNSRKRINWRTPESLFALSFGLMPFAVFNQQVITGRSLQPFHYEQFIANYVVLIGLVVASAIVWRGSETAERPIRYRVVGRLVFFALLWAAMEVMSPNKVIKRDNQFIDRAAAVCERLGELSKTDGSVVKINSETDSYPLVLASDNKVAIILPTFASHAVLWAPHFDFLNLRPGESRERFYKYLYYTAVNGTKLATELRQPRSSFAAAAFGHERVIPDLAVQAKPVTDDEIDAQVAEYQKYYLSFTREQAAQHILSYVIVPLDGGPDLSNLDRWYQRDAGEKIDGYILYRVQLRS
jgi:hypothetical protein